MIAGATPIRASVSAKVLLGPATTMSHAPTSPKPPARTCPSIAPITGTGSSKIARNRPVSCLVLSVVASPSDASDRSAPAQNVLPVCPSTTARTFGSAAASRRPWCSCSTRADDSALRLCGESRVTRAVAPSTVYSTYMSVRTGQAQRGLRDEVEHHLAAHRRDAGQTRDGDRRSDAVLLRQPVSAQRLHGLIDRASGGLAGGVLRDVCGFGRACVVAAVVQGRGLLHHQLGEFDLDVVLRQRM